MIECVVVVAIMAIATVLLAAGLAPSAQAARLRDASSALLDLDARARLLARRGEPVVIQIKGARAVAARAVDERPIIVRDMPRSVSASILDPQSGQALPEIRIGAGGCGPDYVLTLSTDGVVSEIMMSGLTGYAFELAEKDDH